MMVNISKILGFIISLPKTFYFNFRALPFNQAIKIPFIVWYKVKIVEIHKGIIEFPNKIRPFMIRMGYGGSKSVIEHDHSVINIRAGKVIFNGGAGFASGFAIDCCGELTFGKNFSTNKNSFISCSKKVEIGEFVMFGDNVTVRDSDGHTVYLNGEPKFSQRPIIIGNHVWIASHAHILKGTNVGDNSIVAYRSLLTKGSEEPSVLWAGSPAKIVQKGINWGKYIQ